jgi:hypothetical protein
MRQYHLQKTNGKPFITANHYCSMNRIFLIIREKYGSGIQETIEKYGKKNILSKTWEIDEKLPPILDEKDILLPDFSGCDLILSYALHPDINLAIIETLKPAEKALLLPYEKAPLPPGYHVYGKFLVGVLRPCCVVPPIDNKIISIFREEFGTPSFTIEPDDTTIVNVEVSCHTRCGAADFVAKNLGGVPISEAYQKAGLLAQYFCKSSAGPFGSIHEASRIHAEAVRKALRRSEKKSQIRKRKCKSFRFHRKFRNRTNVPNDYFTQ